jgi:diacylglycerol O-acyltransferase
VAWTDGIPFAPVRRLAHELDMRVNDIFMSLLAGAFGRLLPDVSDLRVSIPVNLRNGRGRDLGNQFGLVLLDLPIGVRDPLQRLHLISERMAFLKASLEAKVTLFGLAAAGHLPMPLEKRLVSLLGARSSAVVSNLPGPRRHVTLAGARMRNLVFWPPQAGGIGIGVSFFTYAGEFSIGVCADRNLLSSPSRLVAAMREELHLLCRHGRGKAGVHGRAASAAAP